MAAMVAFTSIEFVVSKAGSAISWLKTSSTCSEFRRIHTLARGMIPLGRLLHMICSIAHATTAHENGSKASIGVCVCVE